MDVDTFDQITIPAGTVGDAANYLLENQTAMVAMHEACRSTSSCPRRSSW